jgi:molybdopterin adenylyltransferase
MNIHQEAAQGVAVKVAVLTLSDTRSIETDSSGAYICEVLKAAGHEVCYYAVLPDEPTLIVQQLQEWAKTVDVILTNGGTGITKRDNTFEALSVLIEKPMPGFGELFRMLSYKEVGAAAMLSRASAGVYQNTLIFAMPGSNNAVAVAMQNLILPQLKHLVWELLR